MGRELQLGRSEVQLGERQNHHKVGGLGREHSWGGVKYCTVRGKLFQGWGRGSYSWGGLSTVREKKEPPQGWGSGEGNTVREELSTVRGK